MAAIDYQAIAQALAVRFGPAQVTAPSGLAPIRLATEKLPANLTGVLPATLVFPPEEPEFRYSAGTRSVIQFWPVRFYIASAAEQPRRVTDLYRWRSAIYAQTEGQVHLGLSAYVTHAVVVSAMTGVLPYAGEDHDGISLTVAVHCWEPLAPVA